MLWSRKYFSWLRLRGGANSNCDSASSRRYLETGTIERSRSQSSWRQFNFGSSALGSNSTTMPETLLTNYSYLGRYQGGLSYRCPARKGRPLWSPASPGVWRQDGRRRILHQACNMKAKLRRVVLLTVWTSGIHRTNLSLKNSKLGEVYFLNG